MTPNPENLSSLVQYDLSPSMSDPSKMDNSAKAARFDIDSIDDKENPTPSQTPTRVSRRVSDRVALSPHASTPRTMDAGPVDEQYRKAERVPEPHSKTSIGRLTYTLQKVPKFHSVYLTVEAEKETQKQGKTTRDWHFVKSSHLRTKAIKQWLGLTKFCMLDGLAAITMQDRDGGARLLIRTLNDARLRSVKEVLKTGSANIELKHTSDTKLAMRITVQEPDLVSHNENTKAVLGVLTRKLVPIQDLPESVPGVDARLPSIVKDSKDLKDTQAGKVPVFKMHARVEPSFELEGNAAKLHLDFDLVPCVPSKSLLTVVNNLVDQAGRKASVISKNLPDIARTLRGIQVRCTYAPRGTKFVGDDKVLSKTDLLLYGKKLTGRRFQIKDIRMANDIKHVNSEGAEVPFSLQKYCSEGEYYFIQPQFSMKALTSTIVTTHARSRVDMKLPFVKDDTSAWIPIELLEVDVVQPLPRFRRQYEVVRKQAQSFMKQGGTRRLHDIGDCVVGDYTTIREHKVSRIGPLLEDVS